MQGLSIFVLNPCALHSQTERRKAMVLIKTRRDELGRVTAVVRVFAHTGTGSVRPVEYATSICGPRGHIPVRVRKSDGRTFTLGTPRTAST